MNLKPKSISLRGEIYDRVKAEATKRGISIRELLTGWINEKLDAQEKPSPPPPPHKNKAPIPHAVKSTPGGSGYNEL